MLEGRGPHCSGNSSWIYIREADRRLWEETVRSGNLDKPSDEDQLRKGLTQLFAERGGVEIRLVPSALQKEEPEVAPLAEYARQG
jgi:hypothetical protein